MDSTVQTVQEVGSQVSQYKQMFENYLPDITKFGIKVVLAIVAFWVGSTVIKWIVKFVRKSLTKSRLDTGVAQFMSSLVKIVLYILLLFNISISFGVKESSWQHFLELPVLLWVLHCRADFPTWQEV